MIEIDLTRLRDQNDGENWRGIMYNIGICGIKLRSCGVLITVYLWMFKGLELNALYIVTGGYFGPFEIILIF